MIEGDLRRVQRITGIARQRGRLGGWHPSRHIERIAHERVPERREVNPNLVGTPRRDRNVADEVVPATL
jgi:hypothetical protein